MAYLFFCCSNCLMRSSGAIPSGTGRPGLVVPWESPWSSPFLAFKAAISLSLAASIRANWSFKDCISLEWASRSSRSFASNSSFTPATIASLKESDRVTGPLPIMNWAICLTVSATSPIFSLSCLCMSAFSDSRTEFFCSRSLAFFWASCFSLSALLTLEESTANCCSSALFTLQRYSFFSIYTNI